VIQVKEGRRPWQADPVSEHDVAELSVGSPPDADQADADQGDVLSSGPAGPRIWLPIGQVADRLGVSAGRVRRLVQERALIGMRRGKEFCVPAELLKDGAPLPELQGTLVVLADAGFTEDEALRWLFTDDGYPGTPVDALRSGVGKTEVRRRAQALAF
jgi:excisionase family DNA binding protein